jgi:putative peptidoglycan lipid II flippase
MALHKKLLSKATKKLSVGNAAALLMVTALLGQVLGFLRVKLVNANFDALGPQSTDAFFAAFKIPDFFFYTVAAGALGVAFIPVLADRLENNDRKGAWELASSLLNLLALVMLVVGVAIFIFAEPLIHVVAPGLEAEQLHNAVTIMRLISFNPFLFTITGILTATQQTVGRFFFYAIGPLLYNSSIIVSIYLFKTNIGLIGLGFGAFVGALLQFCIVLFGMKGMKFSWRARINFKLPGFKTVLRQLPPRSIDQGIDSINSIVETNFARRLGTGFLSYYENAFTLHTAPIILIGTAISTAAFPRMSERLSQGRTDLFRKEFLQVLRAMIWISVPIVVICFFARGYLARIIFAKDAPEIAAVFGFLCIAILFRIMYSIISRYFYAQKDTWTPLFVSIFAIGLNIVLAWQLSRPEHYGVSGLAMAQSIVAASEVIILFSVMLIRDHRLFDRYFLSGVWKILSVTGFSVVAAFFMVQVFPLRSGDTGVFTLGSKVALITLVTAVVHVGLSSLFSLEEARPVVEKMKKISKLIYKPVKIDY